MYLTQTNRNASNRSQYTPEIKHTHKFQATKFHNKKCIGPYWHGLSTSRGYKPSWSLSLHERKKKFHNKSKTMLSYHTSGHYVNYIYLFPYSHLIECNSPSRETASATNWRLDFC